MRSLLQQRKKGISEMLSYSMLIIIAVGLSVVVYSFLKVYIPKERTVCPDGVSIAIEKDNTICEAETLTINYSNKGLFTIDAAYVRLGEQNKPTKVLLNKPTTERDDKFYLVSSDGFPGLKPGFTSKLVRVNKRSVRGSNLVLEVQPVIRSEKTGKDAACTNAIVILPIECNK